jgi:RNA polymerase sigma-70 factor, ECF subfamily
MLFPILIIALMDDPPPSNGDSSDPSRLVTRAQKGDREAVAALYQRFAPPIFRYIVRRVPSTADAEDLTAEVFLRMVESLPTYKQTGAPFEAWLYRIAAFRVADFYRRTARVEEDLSEFLMDDRPLPEAFLDGQRIEQMRGALRRLPDEYQTILILRFVERKTHEEVAHILGKTVASIKNVQYRALSRLTELLGQDQKIKHYLRGTHG